jgi:hypothetical protein
LSRTCGGFSYLKKLFNFNSQKERQILKLDWRKLLSIYEQKNELEPFGQPLISRLESGVLCGLMN